MCWLCLGVFCITTCYFDVEGLSAGKLEQIILNMDSQNIDLLIMTETHCKGSEYYIISTGHLVISSGSAANSEGRCFSGVGFIVSPKLRSSLLGFNQRSDRLAKVKLRVEGGKCVVIAAYAPHNERPHDERQRFFAELSTYLAGSRTHGPSIVAGDLNARIHRRQAGEEDYIGSNVFGNSNAALSGDSNRALLIELCAEHALIVGNTLVVEPPERQVTYFDLSAAPMDSVSSTSFAQLDLFLLPQGWASRVKSIFSLREAALASHHFLVVCRLQVTVPKILQAARPTKCLAWDQLRNCANARTFAEHFDEALRAGDRAPINGTNLDDHYRIISDAFQSAAAATLPVVQARPAKPWISSKTLQLIDKRNALRREGRRPEEVAANKEIRRSARKDRELFLNRMASEGSWTAIRNLRCSHGVRKQGRLKDESGEVVDSDQRAETMARHLESIQWAVRPASAVPQRSSLGPDLPVFLGRVTSEEVFKAAKKLRWAKAVGSDNIPGECWRAVLLHGSGISNWAVEFCQRCWDEKAIPKLWHEARVVALYKKGDESLCNNYRPISLVQVGYKLFASILLERLLMAGCDNRLWPSQFGFRPRRGTADAVLVARRVIEDAWGCRDGSALLLALDWAKAFDSVSPESLIEALRRFGIPADFRRMVASIYSDRKFFVKEDSGVSEMHEQRSGISQGCPLSPLLFVIVMTVLMNDAKHRLSCELGVSMTESLVTNDLLYADDTLLIDVSGSAVQQYMACVSEAGREYGLSFNWSKLELLRVRGAGVVRKPDGTAISPSEAMVYLGSQLSACGRIDSELSRRLGCASADFRTLGRIWNRAGISRKRKIEVFNACVASRLLYCLATAWLPVAARRRIDGFQARCLRRILHILPSHLSFVSNATVRGIAKERSLSSRLLEQQLQVFGRAAVADSSSTLRRAVFEDRTLLPRPPLGRRAVGRPRVTWTSYVRDEALKLAGGSDQLDQLLGCGHVDEHALRRWRNKVKNFFHVPK